jgi:hypothetical protein
VTMLAQAPEILVCCGFCGGEGQIERGDGPDVRAEVCPDCNGVPLAIVPHKGEKIVTNYWRKPGPTNQFDWCAVFADDEPNDNGSMLQGYGATESEAIEDLLRCAQEAAECADER